MKRWLTYGVVAGSLLPFGLTLIGCGAPGANNQPAAQSPHPGAPLASGPETGAPAPSEVTPVTDPRQTFHGASGFTMTPLEVKLDDVAQSLGLQMWKFKVVIPAGATQVRYELQLRQHGKLLKAESNVGLGVPSGASTLLVALVPLVEAATGASHKYKLFVRTASPSTSGSVSSTIDNPFVNMSTSPSNELQPDGSYLLLSGSKSGAIPGPDNLQLLLKVTAPGAKPSSAFQQSKPSPAPLH